MFGKCWGGDRLIRPVRAVDFRDAVQWRSRSGRLRLAPMRTLANPAGHVLLLFGRKRFPLGRHFQIFDFTGNDLVQQTLFDLAGDDCRSPLSASQDSLPGVESKPVFLQRLTMALATQLQEQWTDVIFEVIELFRVLPAGLRSGESENDGK